MNSFKYFTLVVSCFFLTGCPHKETYRYQGQSIIRKGVEISPQTVFFKKWKNYADCTIGLKIINSTDNVQKFNFQRCYIVTLRDTIPIQNVIFELGKLKSPKEGMIILPKSDTLVGLYFNAKSNLFKGDLNLFFSSSHIEDISVKYKRVR